MDLASVHLALPLESNSIETINGLTNYISYCDLPELPKISDTWRLLTERLIQSHQFLTNWIRNQLVESNVFDCYVGVAKSIQAVHGDSSEGVDLLMKFVRCSIGNPNRSGGVSMMLSAFFAAQEESADLKTLGSKMFEALEKLRCRRKDFTELTRRDRALFLFEASRKVQTYIQGALFFLLNHDDFRERDFKAFNVVSEDDDGIDLCRFDQVVVHGFAFSGLREVSVFFRAALDFSETDEQLGRLAADYKSSAGSNKKVRHSWNAGLIVLEPSLLRLLLHRNVDWSADSEVKDVVYSAIKRLHHLMKKDEIEVLAEFVETLAKVKRHNLRDPNGREKLEELCDALHVIGEQQNEDIVDNPYYRALRTVFAQQ